jgi:hypothetical protein
LIYQQDDVVGGAYMVEDGPSDADSVVFMRDITTITSDRVAHLYIGVGARSAALAADLYGKVEREINLYFVQQSKIPSPADFENEAVRFALWMYRERDKGAAGEGEDQAEESQGEESEGEESNVEESGGEESDDLYD